jgi:autotransporter-associated beta strand protein
MKIKTAILVLAAASLGNANASDILWSSSGGSAWLTAGNWTGSTLPTATDNAQFGTNPTGSSGAGINFNNPTNAGTQTTGNRIEDVGAIELTSARTSGNPVIGNSSTKSGAVGVLRLKGTTVNSVTNVILRNNSSQNLTIQNTQATGDQTMALSLGNTTENMIVFDSSGNITISNVIKSDTGTTPLTIMGAGSGRVDITGTANTFTGNINITGAEVRFSANGSLGNAANTVTVDGGRLGIVSAAGTVDLSSRSIYLGSTEGTSISAPGALTTILKYDGVLQNKNGSNGILVKQGQGILSLGGVSTYTGDTSINNGNIQLTTGTNRLPTGTVVSLGQSASANLGTLDLNGQNQQIAGLLSVAGSNAGVGTNVVTSAAPAALTINCSTSTNYVYGTGTAANSGVISGGISLVKLGVGTQTLGGDNTYSGTTTVSEGSLLVNGALSNTSATTVSSGATLGGSGGTIAGGVTVDGTIAPGTSATIGQLTTGALEMRDNSHLAYTLDTATPSGDALRVNGNLTLASSSTVDFTLTNAGVASVGKLTLLAYNGVLSGSFSGLADNAIFDIAGDNAANHWKINYADTVGGSNLNGLVGYKYATITAIPESSAAALGGLGMLTLLRRRRK